MKSNSSTSSFEFNSLEHVRQRPVPGAFIALMILVALIESALWSKREWFADQAAYYWQAKAELVKEDRLQGDIAILGTSVLFHGIDAQLVNDNSVSDHHVINLSLNGLRPQHQAQLLERYLTADRSLDSLILELRDTKVDRASWLSGPYWRFWATWPEFQQSRFYYWEPNLTIDFVAHRVLASYAYRRGLDNWIFSCLRSRSLSDDVEQRNNRIREEMVSHHGYCKGGFERGLEPSDIPPPQKRDFVVSTAGDYWIRRTLALCRKKQIAVAFLKPPSPEFVVRDRLQSEYDRNFQNYVNRLRHDFPQLEFYVIEPENYQLPEFADDHHLSYQGTERLSEEIADWIDENR